LMLLIYTSRKQKRPVKQGVCAICQALFVAAQQEGCIRLLVFQ
jgi:hypothetical protein